MCAPCTSLTCLVGEYIIVVIVYIVIIVQCKLLIKFLKGKSSIMVRNLIIRLKSF